MYYSNSYLNLKEGINLGILGRFRKKEKEEKKPEEVKKTTTDLEIVCGDDKDVYEALSKTMLLHPEMTKESMEEAEKKAKEFEDSGDQLRTRICYHTAGQLAIWRGDVEKVKKFFGKCKELSNMNYKILEIPERAVAKAQEYYKKYPKEEEKK